MATDACVVHGFQQNGMLEKLAVLNHQLNARAVHVDDAPGADIEMADLAITHLSFGQANRRATGLNQSIGIFT